MQTSKAFRSSGRFFNAVFTFSDNTEMCNARTTSNPEAIQMQGRISSDKRASVYEYLVHSRVSATRKLLLAGTGMNCQPFVEVRLVATVMKSIALVQSGLIFRSPRAKGATQEARFSSYCRLLPPRQIANLFEGNKVTGAGDGNRTHVLRSTSY